MSFFVKWGVLFILAEGVLFAFQLLFERKEKKPAIGILRIVVKYLLAIAFAALPMAGPVQLRPVQPFMIALYVALLADAFADTVYSAAIKIRKKERRLKQEKIISFLLAVVFFVYGTVNMQVVLPHYHTYTSEKLTKEHKIVFVSDIHIGSVQRFETFEKTVKSIAQEQPECIILGGDITDDYTKKEEMEAAFACLGKLDIPVYYLYGNHDRQKHARYANGVQFTAQELENTITNNGIIILKDEYAELSDDLLLLGREDISEGKERAGADTLKNPAPEKYLIVADHQPFEFRENLATGADMQLSGHTHAGQLFPLRLLYSAIGYAYGDFYEGDAVMNVSAGAGGWRVPFRNEAHCYYEVITLKPAAVKLSEK